MMSVHGISQNINREFNAMTDRQAKPKFVERSKKVLLEALKDKGMTLQQQQGYTKKSFKILRGTMLSKSLILRNKLLPNGWESLKASCKFWGNEV
jgi:hypothetical protein